MTVISRKAGSKVVHFAKLCKCLFYPVRKSDRDATERMKELAKIAADAILADLRDKKKATHKYLSSNGKEHSWRYCPKE